MTRHGPVCGLLVCALWVLGGFQTAEGSIHTNRLAKEKSPYLLQHAHNPVDWYAWGEEAFEKARREEKPIFLSIGYSTCHWCHVMERESFENPEIAALLNQHFVSIKVDREERPDVDALYMKAVLQMTGHGGWPMSVFLTPELKPFYGGTYFPPEERWGQPGFKGILRSVAQAWADRRPEILESGRSMVEALQSQEKAAAPAGRLDEEVLRRAFESFSGTYDDANGGFAPAPKFPRSHALSFLLRYGKRAGDAQALAIAEHTLRAMAEGGIRDHVGGGFHRYSTDAQWHVPHFEKMLYDQALLARTYLEVYQVTHKPEYSATAREIFEYVLREMMSPEGGFYSAEDADSATDPAKPEEKAEGAFYVWTAAELKHLLGAGSAEIFGYIFGVRENGNAEQDPTGEFTGKNILHRVHTVQEAAQKFGKPEKEITQTIDRARPILFEARKQRPRPYLDDKVLTDWNGLMVGALALGSRVLEEPRYAEAARRAADFLLANLTVRPELSRRANVRSGQAASKGRLLHRYRDGEAAIPAHLEDYAFLIQGLSDLYEATFEVRYLAEAKRLTEEMVRLFWDDSSGGFFLTGTDAEALLVRQKEVYDGAVPSGNSVAALGLLRMGRFTGNADWEKKAGRLLEHFSGALKQNPSAYPQLLEALDFLLGPSGEIVLAARVHDPALPAFTRELFRRFIPNRIVVFHPEGEAGQAVEKLIPFVQEQTAQGGKATAYVCRNYTCSLPSTSLEQFKQRLAQEEASPRASAQQLEE